MSGGSGRGRRRTAALLVGGLAVVVPVAGCAGRPGTPAARAVGTASPGAATRNPTGTSGAAASDGSAARGTTAPGTTAPGTTAPGTGGGRATSGGGSAAGGGSGQPLPSGHAPGRSYPVGTQTLRVTHGADRLLDVSVWYPARTAGRDAAAAPGRFPVVLFSHGLDTLPGDYAPLLRRWAAAGIVVVAPAYPHTHRGLRSIDVVDVLNQPGDASFVLSRVLTGRVLQAAVDPSRVAAAGHSAGGITTVGLFTSSRDARLVAGVVLAGSGLGVGTGFTGPPAWLLFVHGNVDPLVTYDGGRQAFQGDPWSKAFLTLPGQGHGLPYLDPGAASFAVVASTTTDFWRLALYGDRAAGARLSTDATSGAGHGAPGTLTSSLPG